jgi:predicted glycosyltransferase
MKLRDAGDLQHAFEPRRRKDGPRVLMYSHDTFGLGHIRRTRAIANALVQDRDDISILIVSGSSLAGSFNFGGGIDFVRIPGVTKCENGFYTSADLRLDLDEVTALREGLIRQTAETFRPDIFIADKEPTGFRGELLPTLARLTSLGTYCVLGVRDVLDEAAVLRDEWHRKGAGRALVEHYDDVFVYGLPSIYEPLKDIDLPAEIERRFSYTGYLRRSVPGGPPVVRYPRTAKGPFILVTTGGGGDGHDLIDWVISAYEVDSGIPLPAIIVYGPYMSRSQRRAFADRIDKLSNVDAIAFDPRLERLMNRASAVVGMGGYNTFCEILSFDKPALLVPRAFPRQEQTIRARRAAELGLAAMLEDPVQTGAASERDPVVMAQALRRLPDQPKPSESAIPGLLDGLVRVRGRIEPVLAARDARAPAPPAFAGL